VKKLNGYLNPLALPLPDVGGSAQAANLGLGNRAGISNKQPEKISRGMEERETPEGEGEGQGHDPKRFQEERAKGGQNKEPKV
jgi:hypothetical protein